MLEATAKVLPLIYKGQAIEREQGDSDRHRNGNRLKDDFRRGEGKPA